jgi:tetratricopeptide (TPR) repeat protein
MKRIEEPFRIGGTHPNAEELFRLGEQYRRGWKVIKDENKAVKYYLEAVAGGVSEAVEALKQLAEEGNSGARFHLGEMYRIGNGVEKDVAAAIEWYRLATKHGHIEAANKLLLMAEEGNIDAIVTLRKLAEKDNSLASGLLKRLTDQGNIEAQYHYGVLLQKKKCFDDAKSCFFKAMLQGHSDAKEAYRAIIANNRT